nr:hypothetical protein [Avibacterium endocarditidis]
MLHYRSAIFAIAGLIGLLVYAVMGWSSADVASIEWRLLASGGAFFHNFFHLSLQQKINRRLNNGWIRCPMMDAMYF